MRESGPIPDRTHNPFNETHWVSCLRENLASSSDGEGLETGLRSTLNGHEGGNPGYSQGQTYELPRQSFTRQLLFRFLKQTLNGLHLIRHDQDGVTIQFYALMITTLLELYLKQHMLDTGPRGKSTNKEHGAVEPTQSDQQGRSRISGAEFVALLGNKVKNYWKIGLHWLTALRDLLASPFDQRVREILNGL